MDDISEDPGAIEHQPDIEDVLYGGLLAELLRHELDGQTWFDKLTGLHNKPEIASGALVAEMIIALREVIPPFAIFVRAWGQENNLTNVHGQKGMPAELTSRLEGCLAEFIFRLENEVDGLIEPDGRSFFETTEDD